MSEGLLAVALGAGMLAAVNPCGFALLPAYVSLLLAGSESLPETAATLQQDLAGLVDAPGPVGWLVAGLVLLAAALAVWQRSRQAAKPTTRDRTST